MLNVVYLLGPQDLETLDSLLYLVYCVQFSWKESFIIIVLICTMQWSFCYSQHLTEALGPLSKEKDKFLSDYNELKAKLNREYEEQSEQKRNYQQEVESLLKINSKIKE